MSEEEFQAPLTWQRPTPEPIRLAGARLLAWAEQHGVPPDVALLEIEIPESDWRALRDQALLSFYVSLSS